MQNVDMLTVVYAECLREAYYAECHYAECHYAECHYAECRGAVSTAQVFMPMERHELES